MTGVRRLIVNADDFGRSTAISAGIIRAHVDGIVTSASLMVRHAGAAEAVAAALGHPGLDLGLHVDLCEWEPVGEEWLATYVVVDMSDREAVAAEIAAQLERFRELVGADPTHLDSHQHVHRDEPVRSVAMATAAALGVPLRQTGAIEYCGAFYGQGRRGAELPEAITPAALAGLIRELDDGVTELCCHPATEAESFTSYSAERPLELLALCAPDVRRALREAGVQLCNFSQLHPASRSAR
ncbi:MAG: ChbG/HpnK family deacetylase [Solirubrobacterales bacterium]|nr:ChbG/HpnK family deacetylase [Solirubrobacterales bacterium]